MRKIFIFIILSFIISNCSNLKYLDKNGLNSNPKTIESMWYKVVKNGSNTFEKELVSRNINYYDKKGRIIKNLCFNSDESLCYSRENHKYDKHGNLIEYSYGKDSIVISHNIFFYNKKGHLISKRTTDSDGKKLIVSYKSDENGNNIEELITNEDGTFLRKSLFEYNSKNQKISMQSFDENDTPKEGIIIQSYDDNGNEYESRVYDFNNKLKYFYREKYDKFNNKILTELYRIKEKDTILSYSSPIDYIYDNKENIIIETHYNQRKQPSWIYEHNITYW